MFIHKVSSISGHPLKFSLWTVSARSLRVEARQKPMETLYRCLYPFFSSVKHQSSSNYDFSNTLLFEIKLERTEFMIIYIYLNERNDSKYVCMKTK